MNGTGVNDPAPAEAKKDDSPKSSIEISVPDFFYPTPQEVNEETFRRFMTVRSTIKHIISHESSESGPILDDICDALLECDAPTGLWDTVKQGLKVGKKVKQKAERRKLYRKVVASLLEQILDPSQNCKLTRKDITDAFEAAGLDRDTVSNQHISKIYVLILGKLKGGTIRELALSERFYPYLQRKIEDISLSRQDWELNR